MAFDDDDDELRESQRQKVCVDCGALSPPTDISFTQVSARFGWRLARAVDTNGDPIVEWHCPKCWAKLKGRVAPDPKKRA